VSQRRVTTRRGICRRKTQLLLKVAHKQSIGEPIDRTAIKPLDTLPYSGKELKLEDIGKIKPVTIVLTPPSVPKPVAIPLARTHQRENIQHRRTSILQVSDLTHHI